MDQERFEGVMSGTAAKVGETAEDLAAQTAAGIQDTLDQAARKATDKAAAVAREASTTGGQAIVQAGDVIQAATREAVTQASHAATALYEQSARAGGYIRGYTAERPLTTLLLAGAVGYALAYLIHRP
jgi:ElaB/YqjD/DUF883 family membrane-anchored ribosome-binding protein